MCENNISPIVAWGSLRTWPTPLFNHRIELITINHKRGFIPVGIHLDSPDPEPLTFLFVRQNHRGLVEVTLALRGLDAEPPRSRCGALQRGPDALRMRRGWWCWRCWKHWKHWKPFSGWWCGTWLLFSHILGIIIPTDKLILFRGVENTNYFFYILSQAYWMIFESFWMSHLPGVVGMLPAGMTKVTPGMAVWVLQTGMSFHLGHGSWAG